MNGYSGAPRLLSLPPEGLDLGDLLSALAPDLVDVLRCCPHHLLHSFLLQLLLASLKITRMHRDVQANSPRHRSENLSRWTVTHLFLGLFKEEPEAFVFLDPGRQLSLALLPRRLQLRLQLP